MGARIKVCCIQDPAEVRLAIDAGVDALGLVSAMPSGPGVIADAAIAAIAASVPSDIATFLLTSRQAPDALVAQIEACRPSTVQLCDTVPMEAYAALRASFPSLYIVQVIHVLGAAAVAEAIMAAPHVDALLLDSGNPALATKELGGTGRTHDWAVSRTIVDAVPVPVFLAGGLHAGNVPDALQAVRPYGVDVCSGVRTGGRLDPTRLDAFVRAVRTDQPTG